jgi:hypothetical protein
VVTPDMIGAWVEVFLIIGVLSILWRDNIYFRFVEHLYVGVAAGYTFNLAWKTVMDKSLLPVSEGRILSIIPLITGLLSILIFSRQYAWLSRFGLAILLGAGIGFITTGQITGTLIRQMTATIKLPLNNINNIITIAATFCALFYFLFTVRKTGVAGYISRFGRWCMMVGFGAAYGTFVFMWIVLATTRIYTILRVIGIVA